MLRDRTAAGGFLQSTIRSTVDVAPDPIRPAVARLNDRLADPVPAGAVDEALWLFARELDDPTGDYVVTALTMWARGRSQEVSGLLSTLAKQARDEVAMRREAEADRSSLRTQTRGVTAIALVLPLGLMTLNHSYLHPYGTARGQLVLTGIIGLYALALVWIGRLTRPRVIPSLLDSRRVPK
jgi:hypothetical protein